MVGNNFWHTLWTRWNVCRVCGVGGGSESPPKLKLSEKLQMKINSLFR